MAAGESWLTSPDADLQRLLVKPPDIVAEVLLQQEGNLVLQHLGRRRRSATPAGAATARPEGGAGRGGGGRAPAAGPLARRVAREGRARTGLARSSQPTRQRGGGGFFLFFFFCLERLESMRKKRKGKGEAEEPRRRSLERCRWRGECPECPCGSGASTDPAWAHKGTAGAVQQVQA